MPRKQHSRRPDLPPDRVPDNIPDYIPERAGGRSQPPGQPPEHAPLAKKGFPTLASMPRVPRPPAWDAPAGDDIHPTARRRATTTARPLTRQAAAPARDGDPDAYDPRDPRAWDAAENAWDAPATWDYAVDARDERDERDMRGPYDDDHPSDPDDREDDARAQEWDGGWDDETRALAPRMPERIPERIPDRDGTALATSARPPNPTQRLLARARSPWSLLRVGLAVAATIIALGLSFAQAGEPSQPFMAYQAHAESRAALNVAQAVKPLTSLKVPGQYDSPAQFALYSPAACSPSAMAEVLTAWGDPRATIGHMIDDLGSYLSPNAGLLDQQGFEAAAAKEGFRADVSWSLSYNQILYLTNQLGLPVIVSFRRDWGYYHYFAGGHFITVTGGDQQGLTMVDSSEYYITYLPRDVFLNLWQWRGDGTAQTIVLVPKDYQYALPPA